MNVDGTEHTIQPRCGLSTETGRRNASACDLEYTNGRFALFELVVSQFRRYRDSAANGQRAPADSFFCGTGGDHLRGDPAHILERAHDSGTPLPTWGASGRRGGSSRGTDSPRLRVHFRGLLGFVDSSRGRGEMGAGTVTGAPDRAGDGL